MKLDIGFGEEYAAGMAHGTLAHLSGTTRSVSLMFSTLNTI
jgi:hypothetical protein